MKKIVYFFFANKAFLFALLFMPVFVSAAPAFSAKVGQAVGGVMERKAIQRGFAANDPRFSAALNATAAVLTAAATGVVAVSGAPIWVTIGLGALAAGAISLAIDATVNWIFNSDGTVTYTVVSADDGGQLTNGGLYWSSYSSSGSGAGRYIAGSPLLAANLFIKGSGFNFSFTQCDVAGNFAHCYGASGSPSSYKDVYKYSNFVGSCPAVQGSVNNVCVSLAGTSPSGQFTKKPDLAADDLTPAQKAAPLNPKVLADIANQAWLHASNTPNYQGLPYSYSDPVTVADVEAWRASNPSSYPSVGDALASAVNPSTGSVPVTTPSLGVNPTPGIPTAPEGTPKLDFGIDPGIGSPTLESTPTGAQILAPITGLMPDLKNFQVPSHQGECPKPVFDISVLHTRVTMDAHCTLFEGVRGPLYNGSLVAWLIAALFIVLSA